MKRTSRNMAAIIGLSLIASLILSVTPLTEVMFAKTSKPDMRYGKKATREAITNADGKEENEVWKDTGELALAQRSVTVTNPDGSTITTGIPDDRYGRGTRDETRDTKGRVTGRVWRDRRGRIMEAEETTYGLGNEKKVRTIIYNPSPEGGMVIGRVTTTITDAAGDETSTETKILDENLIQTGGSKTETDANGRKRTYRWDPEKRTYLDVDPSGTPQTSGQVGPSSARGFDVISEVAGGLNTTIFATPRGKIRVNLPDDMAAGDTLSGTVIAEPQGKNESEIARNQGELNGYVVELEKQQTSSTQRIFKLAIPAAISTTTQLILRDKKGKEVARTPVPVASTTPPVAEFDLPIIGQQGRPVEVRGPFDGDTGTTRIGVGGNDLEILAESPRKVVARTPSGQSVGPSEIEVREKDGVVGGEFRTLGIKLSATKLDLLRGEQTTLLVTVTGLEGIKEPVPLVLENKSSNIIQMAGGETQRLTISPSQVQGGRYTTERPITGVQRGAFTITGTVVSGRQRPGGLNEAAGGPQTAADTPGYLICGSGCKPYATEQGTSRIRCVTTPACRSRGTDCTCHLFRRTANTNEDYEHVENPEVYTDMQAGYDYVCRCVKKK